jgi:hypothetical protein
MVVQSSSAIVMETAGEIIGAENINIFSTFVTASGCQNFYVGGRFALSCSFDGAPCWEFAEVRIAEAHLPVSDR